MCVVCVLPSLVGSHIVSPFLLIRSVLDNLLSNLMSQSVLFLRWLLFFFWSIFLDLLWSLLFDNGGCALARISEGNWLIWQQKSLHLLTWRDDFLLLFLLLWLFFLLFYFFDFFLLSFILLLLFNWLRLLLITFPLIIQSFICTLLKCFHCFFKAFTNFGDFRANVICYVAHLITSC